MQIEAILHYFCQENSEYLDTDYLLLSALRITHLLKLASSIKREVKVAEEIGSEIREKYIKN